MQQLKDDCLCKTCLGCGQLDHSAFKGVNRCNDYKKNEAPPETFIDKIIKDYQQERMKSRG